MSRYVTAASLAALTVRRFGISLFRLAVLTLAFSARAAEPALTWDVFPDTWAATDALGRTLSDHAATGDPRPNRTVGVFYFLWLGQHGRALYDLPEILAADPADPKFGPPGAFHFWGKPLFGHYLADDRAVIRKHAQMLADAGVDVMIFDVTNALTYPSVYTAVCDELAAMREAGQRTPRVAFIANSNHAKTVKALYDDFYAKGVHADLWFRWRGKPLLLTPPDGLDPKIADFFTIRHSWAWSDPKGWFGDGHDKWTWVDHYPQKPGWHDAHDRPEEISVATAQHPVSNIGRSFHDGKQPPPDQVKPGLGLCFAEQWKRALAVDPEFVFVTGWNEWVAQRFVSKDGGQTMLGRPVGKGGTYFVDQYSQEFSRDIEPMAGGHGANFYYQMVDNVRRYKGTRPLPPVTARPITIDGHFDDWRDVGPEFRDTIGDPVNRDHDGFAGQPRFVNKSGRNDFVAAKVSYDKDNVYFYARTKGAISPRPTGSGKARAWMLLFIDTDGDPRTGWLGYDVVVNRTNVRDGTTTVERHAAGKGYAWDSPADVAYRVHGDEIELAVPRAALGIKGLPATIHFKWADNIGETGEAGDFTLNGDVAPNDRFNYRAVFK